jgi:septal ring factor EnvC (AmiA/AmiB activator)
MSPEVTAAIIAGSVGIVTVIATVIVQIVGFRSTRANTERQIKATEKNTADTLGQQREQLDKTLAEQRARTLNERFATAADQLGGNKPPAVRLAGVHALVRQ